MSTRVFKVTDYGVVPGKEELQTEALQRVFDMCKDEGGHCSYTIRQISYWRSSYVVGYDTPS